LQEEIARLSKVVGSAYKKTIKEGDIKGLPLIEVYVQAWDTSNKFNWQNK